MSSEQIFDLLNQVGNDSSDPATYRAIELLESVESVPIDLYDHLKDIIRTSNNDNAREISILLMRKIKGKLYNTISFFKEVVLAPGESNSIITCACRALGNIGLTGVDQLISILASSLSREIRSAALIGLGVYDDKNFVINHVIEYLGDYDSYIRKSAATRLASQNYYPLAKSILHELLLQEYSCKRVYAAYAISLAAELRKQDEPIETLATFCEGLTDSDDKVRYLVSSRLEKFPHIPDSCVDKLIALLTDNNRYLVINSFEVLLKHAPAKIPNELVIRYLLCSDMELKSNAAFVASELPNLDESVIKAVGECFLNTGDPFTLKFCAYAIEKAGKAAYVIKDDLENMIGSYIIDEPTREIIKDVLNKIDDN